MQVWQNFKGAASSREICFQNIEKTPFQKELGMQRKSQKLSSLAEKFYQVYLVPLNPENILTLVLLDKLRCHA